MHVRRGEGTGGATGCDEGRRSERGGGAGRREGGRARGKSDIWERPTAGARGMGEEWVAAAAVAAGNLSRDGGDGGDGGGRTVIGSARTEMPPIITKTAKIFPGIVMG